MSTPDSNPVSYLDPVTFLQRFDWRTIGDLCSDTGTRLTLAQLLGPPVNVNLQVALDDAAGELEAACLVAGRYSPAALLTLTGVAGRYRDRIIAVLAMSHLVWRRPDLKKALPSQYEDVQKALDLIRLGERVFGLVEVEQAGQITDYVEQPQDFFNRNGVVNQARRFFGQRSREFPAP
ncbi:MAG: hypothetical protein KGL39_29705 [Patescibacteria group bacterium]|nr:hypothetical protein [Patescibacteria group bacterium]